MNDANQKRKDLINILSLINLEPLSLQPKENFQVQFNLAGKEPMITFSGSLRVEKDYNKDQVSTIVSPWYDMAIETKPNTGAGEKGTS